jgi:VIT1/CCC1 family predicted Fe2+/Mn2+ transporter
MPKRANRKHMDRSSPPVATAYENFGAGAIGGAALGAVIAALGPASLAGAMLATAVGGVIAGAAGAGVGMLAKRPHKEARK